VAPGAPDDVQGAVLCNEGVLGCDVQRHVGELEKPLARCGDLVAADGTAAVIAQPDVVIDGFPAVAPTDAQLALPARDPAYAARTIVANSGGKVCHVPSSVPEVRIRTRSARRAPRATDDGSTEGTPPRSSE
jgi:hypothetical protein